MAYTGLRNLGHFGQTEDAKEEVTAELLALEKAGGSPVAIVRGTKALLAKLRQMSRWDDSRSGITASFLNFVKDDETHRSFLKYTDISARATALMTEQASHFRVGKGKAVLGRLFLSYQEEIEVWFEDAAWSGVIGVVRRGGH